MPNVKIEYYGVEGIGRTVTDAKKDAGAKIKAALEGDFAPILVEWRGTAWIAFREPLSGWHTAPVKHNDEDKFRVGRLNGSGPYRDSDEAIASMVAHVAQLGWLHADPDDFVPEIFDEIKDAHRRKRAASDFKSWTVFQRRHLAARSVGCNDNDAHHYAGHGPREKKFFDDIDAKIEMSKRLSAIG